MTTEMEMIERRRFERRNGDRRVDFQAAAAWTEPERRRGDRREGERRSGPFGVEPN